jgi:peptidoglycan hydrolase-like protein with peptidoglycan-binding domain
LRIIGRHGAGERNAMANPGQPTIQLGSTGDVVRRAQRALRRTPNLGLVVDGIFGPLTEGGGEGVPTGRRSDR